MKKKKPGPEIHTLKSGDLPVDRLNRWKIVPGIFEVQCIPGQAKVSAHQARFQAKEEVRFPLNGDEHFVHVLEGEIEYLDQNTNASGKLILGETLWLTRPREVFLMDLRSAALGSPARCAWAIISYP